MRNLAILSSFTQSGDVLYSGKVKIKTGRGSFQRWRKRNVEIIYPCRMKLSKKKVMKKKVKEFSLTTFDRLEDAPWFGFRLLAEDDSRSIDVRCTDLYEYLNLVHALQMLLDMRNDASEFDRGIPEDVRSSGSLHVVREDNADKERDAVNELELIQRLGEDFPESGDELVHQPQRHSKYTLAEMEKSRKNTATADDTETQHNAEKDSVSVTADSAEPQSINLSHSNSSIASLEEILTSKSSSATVKSDDNEENQACNDDSGVVLNDITRQNQLSEPNLRRAKGGRTSKSGRRYCQLQWYL
ncbi:uncharacterized protein [Ptychodera flava]|uniref:uncharacterized protein n=1 Tax=Ptychodera flava TaxID=63121 RepID=UPI00396A6EF9